MKLLLHYPKFHKIVKNEIELTDIEDANIKTVLQTMIGGEGLIEPFNPSIFIDQFDNQNARQLMTKALADPMDDMTNAAKMLDDCVERLKSKRIKKYRQELREKMTEAELEGNLQELDNLKELFNQSIKG